MTAIHPHHPRPSRPQRGAASHGWRVAVVLASGLGGAVGLQLAGPQLQDRLATLFGVAPGVRVAMPCPADMAPENPAFHAPKAHAMAASFGVGVMPAI
jgi:hypothetical protein